MFTYGLRVPTTLFIELSTGLKLYDYSMFDKSEEPDPLEAEEVCKILAANNFPLTGCKLLKSS